MFESRSPRNFNSAPQSVTAFIATVLEPAITVLVYLGALAWHGEDVGRADLTLCFLVLALTFPGINRFRDRLMLPIQDGRGRIVAFTGLRNPDGLSEAGEPEWSSTPTTDAYPETEALYGDGRESRLLLRTSARSASQPLSAGSA